MNDLLRGKRLEKMNEKALNYTASINFDSPLLPSVIKINKAHTIALYNAGVLSGPDALRLLKGLNMEEELPKESMLEDVHMFVEQKVREKTGEIGGYLNLGKSRNDQVATAIKMVTREYIIATMSSLLNLSETLVNKAERSTEMVMPVYTHLQVAQPITFAHWLLAYENMISRDIDRLSENYRRVNSSPMGAAASAGTTVKINRKKVADYLGFASVVGNSIDAVSSRDTLLEFIFITSSIALTLSRLSEDINFMSNNETGILIVPDSYASTSSAMPQKKNSVVTEIARACPGIILGNLASTICVYKALPSSYNLDLQEMTPKMSESYLLIQTTVDVMKGLIEGLEFNEKRSNNILIKNFSTAMETAEYITIKMGIPFREAHHILGAYVRECLVKELEPLSEEAYSVFLKELTPYKKNAINFTVYKSLLDPKQSVIKKTIYGGPSPSNTIKMVSERRLNITKIRENIRKEAERLTKASSKLDQKVAEIIGGESS